MKDKFWNCKPLEPSMFLSLLSQIQAYNGRDAEAKISGEEWLRKFKAGEL
jgi:hypothetical protein